jgi:hypothetical protein
MERAIGSSAFFTSNLNGSSDGINRESAPPLKKSTTEATARAASPVTLCKSGRRLKKRVVASTRKGWPALAGMRMCSVASAS